MESLGNPSSSARPKSRTAKLPLSSRLSKFAPTCRASIAIATAIAPPSALDLPTNAFSPDVSWAKPRPAKKANIILGCIQKRSCTPASRRLLRSRLARQLKNPMYSSRHATRTLCTSLVAEFLAGARQPTTNSTGHSHMVSSASDLMCNSTAFTNETDSRPPFARSNVPYSCRSKWLTKPRTVRWSPHVRAAVFWVALHGTYAYGARPTAPHSRMSPPAVGLSSPVAPAFSSAHGATTTTKSTAVCWLVSARPPMAAPMHAVPNDGCLANRHVSCIKAATSRLLRAKTSPVVA
mmetsp:Transcript_11358/g.28975  ORF Transcript_11358/g.28975 Transcript_11358/m.28975 type:complete len:293 (+) Transcript_11358:849-1727(+)